MATKHAYCGRHRVSARQLAMGIKVEHEHTQRFRDKARANKRARDIACQHLSELPDYYTRLAAMERNGRDYWRERR